MKTLTLYTKDYCPYCRKLIQFVQTQNITHEVIEVSDKPELHQKIIDRTSHSTVPAVFYGEQFIGGSEDFYKWYEANKGEMK